MSILILCYVSDSPIPFGVLGQLTGPTLWNYQNVSAFKVAMLTFVVIGSRHGSRVACLVVGLRGHHRWHSHCSHTVFTARLDNLIPGASVGTGTSRCGSRRTRDRRGSIG
jgi:hypothetical protein